MLTIYLTLAIIVVLALFLYIAIALVRTILSQRPKAVPSEQKSQQPFNPIAANHVPPSMAPKDTSKPEDNPSPKGTLQASPSPLQVSPMGQALADRRTLPYRAKRRILSPAERSFYGVLNNAIGKDMNILAKVRLEDIIEVAPGEQERWKYRGHIRSRHIDFVLCDQQQMAPLLAVELDDRSHNLPERQERDEFVDRALRSAGIPILRQPVQTGYRPDELRRLIQERIGETRRRRTS
jgi:hypothetical protein